MDKYTIEDYLNEMTVNENESKTLDEFLADVVAEAKAEGLSEASIARVKEIVKGAYEKAKGKAKAGKEAVKGAGAKVAAKATAAKVAVKGAGTKVAAKATTAKEAVKGAVGKVKGKHLAGIGAAAALGGGALAYRRFFGKAAKACKDKKGAEKAACMKKFRHGATEAAIMALQDGQFHCDESKTPKRCYRRVNEAIAQLRDNLDVLREG